MFGIRALTVLVSILNYYLNTRHLNTGQVKVSYADFFIIQIPTKLSKQYCNKIIFDFEHNRIFTNKWILVKYSENPSTEHVRYLNGGKLFGCQMVKILNGSD